MINISDMKPLITSRLVNAKLSSGSKTTTTLSSKRLTRAALLSFGLSLTRLLITGGSRKRRGTSSYPRAPDWHRSTCSPRSTKTCSTLQDALYRQTKGTAMGAAYAPNYAGLHLGLWEESSMSNDVTTIIRRNWDILLSDPALASCFPEPPIFSFRRAPTLQDTLNQTTSQRPSRRAQVCHQE